MATEPPPVVTEREGPHKAAPVPKFINEPQRLVTEALDALTICNPEVERLVGTGVIVRRQINPDEVALVCGGGSGHEPAHSGFVTDGLLTAAVCGEIFASPPHSTILAAINHLASKGCGRRGILVLVKNYGGDLINFGYAVKAAKVAGVLVEMVVIGDDVALGLHNANRRGIAGTVALYKVLGAAAKEGQSLPELVSLAHHALLNMRSMGASLTTCALPGSAATTRLRTGEIEVGLGIHGEPGLMTVPNPALRDLVELLLEPLVNGEKVQDRMPSGTHVALLVNNLGSTTDLEIGAIALTALQQLKVAYTLRVDAVCTGRFMTALEMHGFSLTLIQLQPTPRGAELLRLLLSRSSPKIEFHEPAPSARYHPVHSKPPLEPDPADSQPNFGDAVRDVATAVLKGLLPTVDHLNALDAAVGDGDLGHAVERAATLLLGELPRLPFRTKLRESIANSADLVALSMGGTSGPLYGAFLMEAASVFSNDLAENNVRTVLNAFIAGSDAVSQLGSAKHDDRTMFDALLAASRVAGEAINAAGAQGLPSGADIALSMAAAAATRCKEVAQLHAKLGRSRYLAGKEVGQPDPGCELVAIWLQLLASAVHRKPDHNP